MGKRFSPERILKAETREHIIKNRRELSASDIRQHSLSIVQDVISLIERKRPRDVVAIYYPINGELDMRALGEYIQEEGGQIALPRVSMEETPLSFNQWNLCEPQGKDIKNIPCSTGQEVTPDIVIVPLLGFDENGHRLGYGSGYYDRTFEKLKNAYKIGVGMSFQQVPPIKAEAHDIPMDAIVTEKGIVFQQEPRFDY